MLVKIVAILVVLCRTCTAGVVFDGVDDSVRASADALTLMPASAGTMMGWIFPTSSGSSVGSTYCYDGDDWIEMTKSGTYGKIGIMRNSGLSGGDRFCAQSYDTDERRVTTPYTTNTWMHLAWVYTGTTLALYKDGLLVGSIAIGAVDLTSSFALELGHAFGAASSVAGTMTGIRTYAIALTANEIEMLGKSRMQRVGSKQPSGDWPLDQCAQGTTANGVAFVDRSGGNHPITANAGGNGTGVTCQPNQILTFPWGPY